MIINIQVENIVNRIYIAKHRGTPLLVDKTRRSHNIVFRRAECDWVNHWNSGTARGMYERNQVSVYLSGENKRLGLSLIVFPLIMLNQVVEKLIAHSKPCQRSVLVSNISFSERCNIL